MTTPRLRPLVRLAPLALLLLSACDPLPCEPGLVLANDADAIEAQRGSEQDSLLPSSIDQSYCPTTPVSACLLSGLDDGDSFVLAHQLPRNAVRASSDKLVQVTLDEPLVVTFETPCGTLTRQLEHDDHGRIEATLIVPPGGGCGMSVSASIANSHSACTYSASSCDDLEARCEGFEGDATADTTDTGTESGSESTT